MAGGGGAAKHVQVVNVRPASRDQGGAVSQRQQGHRPGPVPHHEPKPGLLHVPEKGHQAHT